MSTTLGNISFEAEIASLSIIQVKLFLFPVDDRSLLRFLWIRLVFDIGRCSILSGTIKNMDLESEIAFLSKIRRKLILFPVCGRSCYVFIDPLCVRCRAILICVDDPMKQLVFNLKSHLYP